MREACAETALAIIEESGLETLSLREVARRLGVSHQAPYKHFASRDHLLADVVARAYAAFARHLDSRPRRNDPFDDLREMGKAYVGYALAHPLQYRLMFATALPDPDAHPEMLRNARHAFTLLREAIGRLPADQSGRPPADLDTLYVWATVHGLASVFQSSAITTLPLSPSLFLGMEAHVMDRLRTALAGDVDEPGRPARAGQRRAPS